MKIGFKNINFLKNFQIVYVINVEFKNYIKSFLLLLFTLLF